MSVTTNRIPRDLLSYHELDAKYQRMVDDRYSGLCDREWIEECTYFIYKKYPYNLSDFMAHSRDDEWDASEADSWSSGTVIKLVERNERVIVGRWYA